MEKCTTFLIKILSVITVASLLVLLVGCKKTGEEPNTNGDFLYKPEELKVVEKADIPDFSGKIMTKEEMVAAYRPHTDWRIYSIKITKSEIKPTGNGVAYYVSPNGDDNNDGRTPKTAIKTLGLVNALHLKSGDVVYFQCGGLWRGQLKAQSGVSYTSYGDGAKPQFRSYAENAAKSEMWLETDTPNVYKYYKTVSQDVGNIVFDEGKANGIKAVLESGTDSTTNKEFKDYKDLNRDLHFVHQNGKLYLRSDEGNPGVRYNSIELCIGQHIIFVAKEINNVTIDNLCLKYGGAHGIGARSNDGLAVTNCEFQWIGGSFQEGTTRFGNGVEIWGWATNFKVDNCYFTQIYDAAMTFQYSAKINEQVKMENIYFTDNVVENCNYSVEYFLGSASGDDYIRNFYIQNNLFWNSGEGFCSQRPDKRSNAHIKSWSSANPITDNYHIKNNLFAFSNNVLIETMSSRGGIMPNYSSNIFIQKNGRKLATVDILTQKDIDFSEENIRNILKDFTAKYILVKN